MSLEFLEQMLETDPHTVRLRNVDRKILGLVRDFLVENVNRVETLDLSGGGVRLQSFGVQCLIDIIHANTQLRQLWLSNCSLTSANIATLAESLEGNRTLKSLDLIDGEVDDVSVNAIASLLKRNESLTEIWFTSNSWQFTEQNAAKLRDAIRSNNSLLCIGCNKFQFSVDIQQCLLRNQSLRWIHVQPLLLDFAIAFALLRLPAYVLCEIFDWLPFMWRVKHGLKIALIIRVKDFFEHRHGRIAR